MDLKLKGKRALVTGGSKGIGRACAEVLAAEGCTVMVAARNPVSGPNAKAIDLSQRGAAEALAAWAGELDILVNNAGASHADGVRVVGINPGPLATDRLKSLFRQRAEAKFGDPERYQELFAGMSFGRPARST